MIKVKDLKDRIIQELKGLYPDRENLRIADIVIQFYTGFEKYKVITDPELVVENKDEEVILQKLTELKRFKPVQYVTGRAYFYDLELEVNPAVLIPRPETEELVKWISDDYSSFKGLRILDIGTGSGCIIIALGKLLENSELTALDISVEAISIAWRNAERYSMPVDFQRINILDEGEWGRLGTFDVIVSNPPYVKDSEKPLMKQNVLDYEPERALFVRDDDPLLFYRAIAKFARLKLGIQGKVYVEINEALSAETVEIFHDNGFSDVALKQDINGKNRMIRACV